MKQVFLKPFELVYHLVGEARHFLFEKSILQSIQLPVPVISVGNLSFGGAGKTPCVVWLAKELSEKGKIVVVCRSYKASLTAPRQVDLNNPDAAAIFGDEACLLQTYLPFADVWSGPIKAETAKAAMISNPAVILIDDGFSHQRLKRNFDMVLVDTTRGFSEPLREFKKNIKRAHAVLLTKSHLVDEEQMTHLKKQIVELAPQLKDSIFQTQTELRLGFDKSQPIMAFCGLGRPETFWIDLKKNGYQVLHQQAFPDHYSYSLHDQKKIMARFYDLKNENHDLKLVTTGKDLVKLTDEELLKAVHIAEHSFVIKPESKEILLEQIWKSL